METLKFLMVNSTYPPYGVGGEANHVRDLSSLLSSKGHEVNVLYSIDTYNLISAVYNYPKNEINPNMEFNKINSINSLKSPFGILDPFLVYGLGKSKYYHQNYVKLLKKLKPDVVHLHDITFLGYDFLSKIDDYSLVHTAHNYWLICPNRELFRSNAICMNSSRCTFCLLNSKRIPQIWRYNPEFQKYIQNLDSIITPSKFLRKKLMEKLNRDVNFIPNFIMNPPEDIEECEYSDYLLYVGVLEPRKGIMDLLEVFRTYSKEIEYKLVIAGVGSLRNRIVEYIDKNALNNKIMFLGYVDKKMLWSLYKGASAIVLPSIWAENNPLVALEALSVGTPIIGSNSGGIPEIIEKINKNLIFKSGDSKELKKIIINFSSQKYTRSDLIDIYKRNYSPEIYLEQYLNLLRKNDG